VMVAATCSFDKQTGKLLYNKEVVEPEHGSPSYPVSYPACRSPDGNDRVDRPPPESSPFPAHQGVNTARAVVDLPCPSIRSCPPVRAPRGGRPSGKQLLSLCGLLFAETFQPGGKV
jgi:hypothetical protein